MQRLGFAQSSEVRVGAGKLFAQPAVIRNRVLRPAAVSRAQRVTGSPRQHGPVIVHAVAKPGREVSAKAAQTVATAPPSQSTSLWSATLFTTGNANAEASTSVLTAQLVAKDGATMGAKVQLDGWDKAPWTSADNRDVGFAYSGELAVPDGEPALLLLTSSAPAKGKKPIFVSRVTVQRPDGGEPVVFPVNSWIDVSQGTRVFFDSTPYLPSQTPPGLKDYRDNELAALQGTPADATTTRVGAERVYDYQVYNDLGKPEASKGIIGAITGLFGGGKASPRPNLGGDTLHYPRRVRTGRPLLPGDYETPAGKPWLPLDEEFDESKNANFLRGAVFAVLPILPVLLSKLTVVAGGNFTSFQQVRNVYEDVPDEDYLETVAAETGNGVRAVPEVLSKTLEEVDAGTRDKALRLQQKYNFAGEPELRDTSKDSGFQKLVDLFNEFLKFEIPRVLLGREVDLPDFPTPEWETDLEFGRQVLAGQHPCVVEALTQLPEGSAITEEQLKGVPAMGGKSLQDHLAAGRVFMVDHYESFVQYAARINAQKNHYQYAGRAVFVLQEPGSDRAHLLPVAIELLEPEAGRTTVYTPRDGNAWLLARAVWSSIDSTLHQLYSHWVRTHAAEEPYSVATRRQLSVAHPVYKWLLPHFRFTMNINSNARAALVNAGGIIERSFTTGAYSMEISSAMYDSRWTFENQGLPKDLESRGMAKLNPDGSVASLTLQDYPYAADGLLIWDSLRKWADSYLANYYTSDAEVTADPELMAWWDEIKTKGHGDIKHGWPELKTRKDLSLILTTIAFAASAHHAAINFGQYDYSGLLMNRPSSTRKPIPARGTPEYTALMDDKTFEKVYLSTVSSPLQAFLVMITVNLLSKHSENEQYLSDKEHFYVFDKAGRAALDQYLADLAEVESEIDRRNSGNSVIRAPSAGNRAIPYTLLQPSSGPGLTFRGVPNSVSI